MLFIFLISLLLVLGNDLVHTGPVWPDTFSVEFHEILYGRLISFGENERKWYL